MSLAPCTPSTERLAPDTSGRRCALCTAAAGTSSPVRDLQAGLSTAIKKRSSVSISRASGGWCALRIIQPSSGAEAQIKHLPGSRAVGRLKTQGHDPLSTPSNSCCGTILTLRSPFCRRMAGDIVAADAAVEAVAKGTQVVEMAGRNHHLNTGSIKPLTYLLSQLRHLLTKLAISAAADPSRAAVRRGFCCCCSFLKKRSLAVTLSPCAVMKPVGLDEDGYRPFAGYED